MLPDSVNALLALMVRHYLSGVVLDALLHI